MTLFCPRSSPFMSSNGIFLQSKWSKIKERVEGWKSGKKTWFKRITVCGHRRQAQINPISGVLVKVFLKVFEG